MRVVLARLNLKNMLSERSLIPKSTYCVFHLCKSLEQAKFIYGKKRNQNGGCHE